MQVGTSSIQVTGEPDLLALLSFLDFNPSADEWTVKFRTSIQAPFKLVNPTVNSVSGQLLTDNRYKTASLGVSSISACNNNSLDCMQEGTLQFVKGTALASCDALSGVLSLVFDLACQEGSTVACPLLGGETVTLTLTLDTGDACPAVDNIIFDVTTLAPFSDAAAS